ncbi:MAG: biotin--[Oscillospiraceae bacterium]|nr:biotin--[acetyl-CoA-carboxylase] ligase [Oscillospiraceae bacterium]
MIKDAVLRDTLSEEGIRRYLKTEGLRLQVVPVISSTNTVLKRMAEEGAEEGFCLIAEEQTAGKGRMGRSFYSPAGSGLYLSVLLRPKLSAADAVSITACAAV